MSNTISRINVVKKRNINLVKAIVGINDSTTIVVFTTVIPNSVIRTIQTKDVRDRGNL